jgi:hypothetical protein
MRHKDILDLSPPLVKGREPVHILPPLPVGEACPKGIGGIEGGNAESLEKVQLVCTPQPFKSTRELSLSLYLCQLTGIALYGCGECGI